MTAALDAINRTLERESWARDKLAAHASRTVRMSLGPIERNFGIDAAGRLVATDAAPDLRLTISPLRVPALLAAPERWSELVHADGDAALAATLSELAATLPWFIEQTFARVLGPVLGQQAADAGRRLLALPGYAGEHLTENVARYVTDEASLAVSAPQAKRFGDDVAAVAARVDTLAQRIANLDFAGETPSRTRG